MKYEAETDGNIGIVSKSLILILILGISISIGIDWGLSWVPVSVPVSIGAFPESRYQSRYRLGALLSPGISPGIDSEAAKVSVSVSVPKFWYRLSLLQLLSVLAVQFSEVHNSLWTTEGSFTMLALEWAFCCGCQLGLSSVLYVVQPSVSGFLCYVHV